MQSFVVSLRIPSNISFTSIRIFDKKMEVLHFARVKFAWGGAGAADVATYEGRSTSSMEELTSRMKTFVVADFPSVQMSIEVAD